MHADFTFQGLQLFCSANPEIPEEFLTRLDREFRPRMISCLESRGASRDSAEDIVSEILSECLAGPPRNLLGRFKGDGPLDGWLLRVAINRFISRHRRERVVDCVDLETIDSLPCDQTPELEGALQKIVSKALREAIHSLSAEARLLLWLRHGYGISQNRLCVCWQSTPSRISRALSSARDTVRDRTLRSIQKEEPGLHLQWPDISGVCAEADLFNGIRDVA